MLSPKSNWETTRSKLNPPGSGSWLGGGFHRGHWLWHYPGWTRVDHRRVKPLVSECVAHLSPAANLFIQHALGDGSESFGVAVVTQCGVGVESDGHARKAGGVGSCSKAGSPVRVETERVDDRREASCKSRFNQLIEQNECLAAGCLVIAACSEESSKVVC